MRPHPALTGWNAALVGWRSITSLVWLIAALAGLSLVSSLLAFQEPDYGMAIRSAQCHDQMPGGTALSQPHRVHLPFAAAAASDEKRVVTICEFALRLTVDEISDTALFVPSFTDSIAVTLNGQRVAVQNLYFMRNLRFTTIPAFIPLSGEVLRAGENRFRVAVTALPGRTAMLDRIFIGSASTLRAHYHARWFVAAVLPTLVVGGEIALAIVFVLIWGARPRETAYGWLALTLALGAARGSVLIPDFGVRLPDRSVWSMTVPWEMAAAVMFCRALAEAPRSRWIWLTALPPLAITLGYSLAPPGQAGPVVLGSSMAMILGYLLMAIWTLGQGVVRGNREALVVLLGMTVLFAFTARDIVSIIRPEPSRVFLARTVFSAFLIAIVTLMTLRFVRAMRELDNRAETLRERVAAAEAELRATYEELRARREAEAVERERGRLMRDLHDGLGGELASVLALADGPKPRAAEIAGHARAALADMRLIISSLEDYGGDLALALGTWRERTEPQLRAAGLSLDWAVRDVPPVAGMGPAQVLDILRIAQEAVTNVIKHAGATRIRVETGFGAEGVVLAICDDGRGGAGKEGGSGTANMQARARRLNAHLVINRQGGETCVQLTLPRAAGAES